MATNTIEHFVRVFENKIDLSSSLIKVVKGLSTENADTMANIISAGGNIFETVRDAKSVKAQRVSPGSVDKIRCKLKDFNFNNSYDQPVMVSPLEEMCLENDLVIIETVELMKKENKFIDIFAYNPSPVDIVVGKGQVLGRVSDVSAAFTLPNFPKTKENVIDVQEIEQVGTGHFETKLNLDHLDTRRKEIALECFF